MYFLPDEYGIIGENEHPHVGAIKCIDVLMGTVSIRRPFISKIWATILTPLAT